MDQNTQEAGINGLAWGAVVVLSHIGLWRVLRAPQGNSGITISLTPKG